MTLPTTYTSSKDYFENTTPNCVLLAKYLHWNASYTTTHFTFPSTQFKFSKLTNLAHGPKAKEQQVAGECQSNT